MTAMVVRVASERPAVLARRLNDRQVAEECSIAVGKLYMVVVTTGCVSVLEAARVVGTPASGYSRLPPP